MSDERDRGKKLDVVVTWQLGFVLWATNLLITQTDAYNTKKSTGKR